MRVLLTTPDFPPMAGGIQLLCRRLVEHSRLSYEVVTVRAHADSGEVTTVPNVTRTPRVRGQRLTVAVLNAGTLKRAFGWRPDAVVAGHLVVGPAALTLQRLLGAPAIQYLYSKELAARPRLARLVTRQAAASIAISSFAREQALASGAPAERLHLIHPGVDAPVASHRPVLSDPLIARPTVITVARLEDRYKGFDVMMAALPLVRACVPDVHWVVVGDGSLRDELQAMAGALGVRDAITFTGALDDAGRNGWLQRADVFAMPGRLMPGGAGGEGFGIAYLEAGAHGLPSVSGNVGGSVDAVIDGETGITVDPTDHVAVADAISSLLRRPELRKRLGDAGRARSAMFTWARMAEQVDDLIERSVSARGPGSSF